MEKPIDLTPERIASSYKWLLAVSTLDAIHERRNADKLASLRERRDAVTDEEFNRLLGRSAVGVVQDNSIN